MPDVLIVGGGIVGAACADELTRRVATVTLVERSELAAGAYGRNHGLLLTPLDPELAPLADWSPYERAASGGALDWDADPIGFLICAGAGEADRAAGRAEAEAARQGGVAVERVEDARTVEPQLSPDVAEAWLLRDGRRVNPALLTVSLAHLAAGRGATVHRHLTVRAFLRRGGRIAGVLTDDGPLEAGQVVLAAGPWSTALLRSTGTAVPIAAYRGWLVQTLPGRPLLRHLVGRAGWHVLPGHESETAALARDLLEPAPADVGSLIQPNPDGTILLGGSRQAAVTNEPEDPGVPRRIVEAAVGLVPALADAVLLASWWGVRPMTPDGRPLIGPVEDGLLLAAGHGSQGVILGGGTAALVASIVEGGSAPPAFDPFRF